MFETEAIIAKIQSILQEYFFFCELSLDVYNKYYYLVLEDYLYLKKNVFFFYIL